MRLKLLMASKTERVGEKNGFAPLFPWGVKRNKYRYH